MPRRKKYQEGDFPPPGTIYLLPLGDGRLGACRVLRVGVEFGSLAALVVASPWMGTQAPNLDNPQIRKTLKLTHHNQTGKPCLIWITEPPPANFKKLGLVELSAGDRRADCGSFSGWDYLPTQVLLQWRWDHDRKAVLAGDAQKQSAAAGERARQTGERRKYLAGLTLAALARKNLFPHWDEQPPPAARDDTVRVMRELIDNLRRESVLTASSARPHLEACVRKLNDLDQLHHGFIETIEREDIYDVFEEILSAAKVPELLGLIEDWRDW